MLGLGWRSEVAFFLLRQYVDVTLCRGAERIFGRFRGWGAQASCELDLRSSKEITGMKSEEVVGVYG